MGALPQPMQHYRYRDYRSWPDSVRGELIDGRFYDMSPAPSILHHDVATRIFVQWDRQLRGTLCKPFIAPVDVLLSGADDDDDADCVVQPDLFIVCDTAIIGDLRVRGAPALILEVLSPSTAQKDQVQKLVLYERAGVGEYWLLQPVERVLTRYWRDASQPQASYGRPAVQVAAGLVATHTLPGIGVDFDDAFTP